ncbi:putative nuclease HARBI1 [Carassius carassius]|uniref:putative nuclease HARBI1 n=1 Tax=Carassius carassius TaxID=217509 RepID=UPI0028696668|nr:putative nuclease HARBI1 [Carassius carassius]
MDIRPRLPCSQLLKPKDWSSGVCGMAISIAILDCDLLLHGRGHKTLDRFDIETVTDEFLLTTFGFPRQLVETDTEVTSHQPRCSLLLSAETHWPGSLTDRTVFKQSSVAKLFEEQDNDEGWLLGDNRYPIKQWLMTPVQNPESPADYRYNLAHTTTHEIVDRTFRAIQTRFRCLDGAKGYLQYSPEKCSHIIQACCLLHNISLQSGLDAWTFERTEATDQSGEDIAPIDTVDPEALRVRQELIENHFS